MARRNGKRKLRNHTRERSHERACRPNPSSRTCTALSILGAPKSLDRCILLYLFAVDRSCVLVTVAFLDRRVDGWRPDLANTASLGRFDFLLRRSAYVRLLGAADEKHGSGQAVVVLAQSLCPERRRQDATCGALQRGAKTTVLELFLRCDRLVADWNRIVVSGMDSLESALAAIPLGVFAPRRCAVYDCKLPDSHLYERVRGAW